MNGINIATLYIIFALIATTTNLITQWIMLTLQSSLYIAMVAGTLTGLVIKYFLDKKWIFRYKSIGILDDGTNFIIYSFFGVFTTILFWGTELVLDNIFQNMYAKYIGAGLGLGIGYMLKYQIDKRFVFRQTV